MNKIQRFICRRACSFAFVAGMLCGGAMPLFAQRADVDPEQQQRRQGMPIVRSIDVQYVGPETISRARILSQIRTRVGAPYSEMTAEQDIRALYQTGQVQNVRMFGEPAGDGVRVIVAVQTKAVVHEIEIEGAQRFSAEKIRKQIKLKTNGPLNEEDLEKGRQNILDMYRAHGFNDVSVQYRVDTEQARATSRVVYTINEGAKGVISHIRFEGNQHFSDYKLRKQMKTKGRSIISFIDKSGRLDEAQLQADIQSVKDWYADHGYIDADVREVRRDRTGGSQNIVIGITEGPQYHVRKLSVVGQKATTEQKIRGLLKMKEGSVYSPKAVHDDAKAIADGYGSGGYVDLNVQPQGTPAGPGLIDVKYTIEEGQRSFVQRINIVGNNRTKDKVIRREIAVSPGDVYNTVRVDVSKARIDNLGYFSKVETFPEDTGVAGRKDLLVQVEEKRTGALNFGAGYSSIDSVVGFAELTQGNFDIMNWPGFTGGGQKFRLRVQFGNQRKDIVMSLTEPYFLDRRLSLGGDAYYREANFFSSVYSQRNEGMSLTARTPLSNFLSLSVTYRLENVEIYDLSKNASASIRAEKGARLKSLIEPSLVFDSRDNPFLTRRGTRVAFTPYIAGGFLGGEEQIYGGDLEASQYFHLPWDTILLLNGEIATVDTWGDQQRVRIFDRLFLGGSNNLRGFEFRDIGPRDANGEPLGGQSMARLTVEYTVPVIEKVRAAVFYDTGVVNANAWDFSTHNVASDVGLGLRMNLPIGPLRIDYGIPIQKNGRNGGGKFNFNVGYQF